MIHRMQHSNSLCAACGKAVHALAEYRTLDQVYRINDTVIQPAVVVANDVAVRRPQVEVRQPDVVGRLRRLRVVVAAREIHGIVRLQWCCVTGSTWHLRSWRACGRRGSCTVWHIGGHLPQLQLQAILCILCQLLCV